MRQSAGCQRDLTASLRRKGLARRAAVVADSYACLTSRLRTLPSSLLGEARMRRAVQLDKAFHGPRRTDLNDSI